MKNSIIESCVEKLRKKKNITLLPGKTDLLIPEKYPWKKDTFPVYLKDSTEVSDTCYNSGGRSVIKLFPDYTVKAKAIGAFENEPPFDILASYDGNVLIVYGLPVKPRPYGFTTRDDAKREATNAQRLAEYKFSDFFTPQLIGTSCRDAVYRQAGKFKGKNIEISATVLSEESDLRVDEVIQSDDHSFNFSHKTYIEWVGNSIGRALRELHNCGISLWTNNPHLGNFLISETRIGICDLGSIDWEPTKIRKERELDGLLEDAVILEKFLEKPIIEGYAGNHFDIENNHKKEYLQLLVKRMDQSQVIYP